MSALMFFIFVSQILYILGKVIVLRGSLLSNSPNRPAKVKLICLSEDDGGALVWNHNLIWKSYSPEKNNLQFHNLSELDSNEINCKMNANKGCLQPWNKQNWILTNSLKTPMGPVFDQRWEEFKQYDNRQDNYDYVNFDLSTEVKLSFSVRVSRDAQILICNRKKYARDSCYWIIIGGWGNTLSVIRKCATEVPVPREFSTRNLDCGTPLASFKHKPLSENEWRSFVITWNPTMRRISVYDTDKLIMTYADKERHLRSSNDYHMFIRSDTAMLYRFHIYNFLHTTVENAVLTSPIFQFNNKMMCVQLFVGLCAECDAHIVLRNYTNDEVLVMVTAKGSSKIAAHGLPMWQSVKIKRNSSVFDYNSKMIIQLIPKLNKHSSNPLWAIANVRLCLQNGALRKGIMISNQDWDSHSGYFWPIETCQKLFYDEHIIVNHLLSMKPDINLDDASCSQVKIGPQCLFSCESDLNSNSDCIETKICYEDDCTGVSGDNCLKFCNIYPYGCKKTNGTCDWQIAEINKSSMLEKSIRHEIEVPQLQLPKYYEEMLIPIEKTIHHKIEIPQLEIPLQPSKYNTIKHEGKIISFVIVIFIKAGAAFYWYRRKKQRSKKLTDEIMQDETNYT